ncbi:cellulose biosynthesis protein BcsQ [Catenovulum adriaticum]|uniref:Cellulose biosynthesis protein BcsQ n=1 Tax=Catenovulum adriaticum TaxID=2984846 RepID=A0ABY7ATN2_9ALTE|nr:cellulose biosynthesis protein BcsQ [Catenovulum sp. TS8]WAJ72471.1 cellulose biosynthesis protein BcsQ [Catenovulum sp. TS8]
MMNQRIFVTGTKGGTGVSSVVANLARSLADSNEITLVIELDSQNQLARHFAIPWQSKIGWQNAYDLEALPYCFYQTQSNINILPYGESLGEQAKLCAQTIIDSSSKLDLPKNSWILFDAGQSQQLNALDLNSNDIILEIANCDGICHSLLYQKFFMDKQKYKAQHYVLINRYNAHSEVESDLFTLWRQQLDCLSPVFINTDEAIKVAVTHGNQAVALYPANSCRADFERLSAWLAHLLTQRNISKDRT